MIHVDFREAPPDLMADIKAALARQADELENAAAASHIASRQQVIRFAAITCTCRRWYDRDDANPPQAGCIVHGAMFLTLKGEVL